MAAKKQKQKQTAAKSDGTSQKAKHKKKTSRGK